MCVLLCLLHPLAKFGTAPKRRECAKPIAFVDAAHDAAVEQVDQSGGEFGYILA